MRPNTSTAGPWPADLGPGVLVGSGAGSSASSRLDSLLLWALAGFALAQVALLALGRGHWVEYLYPVGSLGFGLLFYWRRKEWLLGFTLWLWMLSALVRRIVDLQAGWNEMSPVLVTPLAVTALAAFTLPRRLHQLSQTGALLMAPALLAVVFGYAITLPKFSGSLVEVTYTFGLWLIPILFGLQIYLDWRSYPAYRRVITRVFAVAIPAVGLYGIWQFVYLPEWDRNWMVYSDMKSIGEPEPFLVRVFSTMNSPGTLSVFLLAGLLFLMAEQGSLRKRLTLVPGYLSFLLCMVRTAWIGWVIGTAAMFVFLPRRSRIRAAIGLALLILLLIPATTVEPIRDIVVTRFMTFTDLSQDPSIVARERSSARNLATIVANPQGMGLGSAGNGFDNGLLEIFYSLGWLAGMAYLGGSAGCLLVTFANAVRQANLFERTLAAVPIAMFPMLISYNVLVGAGGVVFWGFTGLSLAGSRWVSEHSQEMA